MAPQQKRKKSQGRKKIEMKLIEDENARVVTFSKRRAGLFKKATELSALCGSQIALIIFSLCGRAYSFGHPNVESVVRSFINRNPTPNLHDSVHTMRIRAAMLTQLKEQLDKKTEDIEKGKRRAKEIEAALEGSPFPITEDSLKLLNMEQVRQLKEKVEVLREKLKRKTNPPLLNFVGPPKPRSVNVPPSISKKVVDLANIERRDGGGARPVPHDWLKL